MNLLDLPGPDFLQLYLTLMAAATVLAIVLRQCLRRPGGDPSDWPGGPAPRLSAIEAAYLTRGSGGAIDAAVASLVHARSLTFNKLSRRLEAGGVRPDDNDDGVGPLGRGIYRFVQSEGRMDVPAVRRSADSIAGRVGDRLRSLGLAPSAVDALAIRLVPALVVCLVVVLGVAKIVVGVSRNRPVGYLVALTFVTAAGAIVFALVTPRRTRRGDRMLASLRRSNAALRTTASRAPSSLEPGDLALAFALYGPAMLSFGPMTELRRAMYPAASGGGSDGSVGSSCGGGGGCGGCSG